MFAWFAETTLVAAGLAALAWLATKSGRFGPATRHLLWLVVLVKMVTPPVMNWPFAVDPSALAAPKQRPIVAEVEPAAPSPVRVTVSTVEASETAENEDAEPAPLEGVDSTPTIEDGAIPVEVKAETSVEPVRSILRIDFPRITLVFWLAASLGFATWQIARIGRFGRRLRGSEPLPGWLEATMDEVAARMGVRPPRAIVSERAGSPFLWCAGRATLVVPKALLGHLDSEQWEGILAHELAHLRRGDPWVCRMSLAAGVLWWWNPLFWLVRNRLEAEAELACDAWAVWSRPGSRRQYAETLVDVCELTSSARVPSPALGMEGAGKFLERRLIMILQGQESCRLRRGGLALAALMALIAAPSWTKAQDPVKPPEPPATPAAPDAPQPPQPPSAVAGDPAKPAASATATAGKVEVRVTGGDDGKAVIFLKDDVQLPAASAEATLDTKAVFDAQIKVNKARAELQASEARLRVAEAEQRLASHGGLAPTQPKADPRKQAPKVERRVSIQIEKDGQVMVLDPGHWKEMIAGIPDDNGALANIIANLQPAQIKAPKPPGNLDALNHRMDSLEKKLDLLLDEMKSRPSRTAPPASRARRPAGGRDVQEGDDADLPIPGEKPRRGTPRPGAGERPSTERPTASRPAGDDQPGTPRPGDLFRR